MPPRGPRKRKRDVLARVPRETELIPWATLGPSPTHEITPDATTRPLPDGRRVTLPGPLGSDIWVVLGREFNRRDADGWDPANERDRTVRLRFADLARSVGMGVSGESYHLLTETADRLAATVVRIREPETIEGTTLVERQTLAPLFHRITYEKRTDLATDIATNEIEFVLNEVVGWHWKHRFRLLDAGLNLDVLRGAGARRLHRLLDAQRHAVDHQGANRLTVSMAWLVDKMPLGTTKPAVARQALDRAHKELLAAGFLSSAAYEPPFTPGTRRTLADVEVVYGFPERKSRGALGLSAGADRSQECGGADSGSGKSTTMDPERVALLASFGLTPPDGPGRSDLHERVLEVQQACRDRGNVGLYTALCKALPEEAYRLVVATIRADRPEVPRAAFVRLAREQLTRHGLPVPGEATDRQVLRDFLHNPEAGE